MDGATNDAAGGDAARSVPGAPGAPMAAPIAVVSTVSTLAGSATAGSGNGTGAAASFSNPYALAVDGAGTVFVADKDNHLIRQVTAAGVVTTLAGSTNGFADGAGAAAKFFVPLGIALDVAGTLYVADGGNQRIRKVTPAGVVTTLAGSGSPAFADGTGAAASFFGPCGLAVDPTGNVFVADQTNHRLRLVTPAGVVSTIAGSGTATFADGTGSAASFNYLAGIAVDGGDVWVADESNNRIRKVTATGAVSTLAGSATPNPLTDGIGAAATFNHPQGIALDKSLNAYVADTNHSVIRVVSASGVVTTLAGTGTASFADGAAAMAGFSGPGGIAVDAARNVYVADSGNNRIRKITSVGLGQLAVTWSAPSTTGGSPILGYVASASAVSHPPVTCVTGGATTCTMSGLASGVVYNVTVTASNAAGTGAASAITTGTPN